jgi:hypothetical protein
MNDDAGRSSLSLEMLPRDPNATVRERTGIDGSPWTLRADAGIVRARPTSWPSFRDTVEAADLKRVYSISDSLKFFATRFGETPQRIERMFIDHRTKVSKCPIGLRV